MPRPVPGIYEPIAIGRVRVAEWLQVWRRLQDQLAIKEQIRSRVDLVDVVTEHTALTRRGRNFLGLCPFHKEKTPSFSVNPEMQFFKCFGCNAGGDIFTFIQLRESVDFPEAMRLLADRAGIELSPTGRTAGAGFGRSDIARINAWACEYFQSNLRNPELGAGVREYVASRGIDPQMIESFRLGLAAGDDRALLRAAEARGFDRRLILDAGLCKTNDSGVPYDTFRDRLIFPIRDTMNRCVGFGGRTLCDAPAKYLNSPQSILFDKSKCLYGIDLAREAITRDSQAILVEGYTDCIAAHQHGFTNTIATLGTSATESHMSSLRRYCESVVLVFDSDDAGAAASDRALGVALKHNLSVRLTGVPDGKDPCDFLQNVGAQEFRNLLNSAQEALVFKWSRTRERFRGDDSPANRREAVSEFVTLVQELAHFGVLDAIQQGIITGQLANLLSVSTEQVRHLMGSQRPRGSARTGRSQPVQPTVTRPRDPKQAALQTLLEVLVVEPALLDCVSKAFEPAGFEDAAHRRIADNVRNLANSVGEFTFAELLSCSEDPSEAEILTDLASRGSRIDDREAALQGAARRIDLIARAKDTDALADQLKREVADDACDVDVQKLRLAEIGRRLAGQDRFAPRRAIDEHCGTGATKHPSEEDVGTCR